MTTDNFDDYRSLDADETSSSSSSSSRSSSSASKSLTSSSVARVSNVLDFNDGNTTDDDDDLDPLSIRSLSGCQHLSSAASSSSSRFVNSRFLTSIRAPKLSLAFREANFKKFSHKLSAHEIFSKFYHHNSAANPISQLSAETRSANHSTITFKPNISQTNKQLTRLLSQTKTHFSSSNQQKFVSSTSQTTKSTSSRKSANKKGTTNSEEHIQQLEFDQESQHSFAINSQSSNDEVSGLVVKLTAEGDSPKRGRDPAEAESCGLSVIEERLDDSDSCDHHQQQAQSPSKSLRRTMERTKEIDMADGDQEPNKHSDDDYDDTSASQASTIIGVKSLTESISEGAKGVATLSASSSDTLTQRQEANTSQSTLLFKSQSIASEPTASPLKHQAETSSASVQKSNNLQNIQQQNVKRSESLQISSKNSIKNYNSKNHPPGSLAANLTKSVGVMKAQQHLLKNLIRHQNQNLIPQNLDSGSSRVRSVFIYPNLGEHQSEYPFVTFKKFPDRMIRCTGGVVSVHSVKLLDHIINDEESETRDIWWTEIRKEISCHAKALNCNTIIGYRETSKVISDVCILSAYGTAAIMSPSSLDLMDQFDYRDNNYYINNKHNHQKHHHQHHHESSRNNTHNHQNASIDHATNSNLKLPDSGSSPPPSHSFMPTQQQMASASSPVAGESSENSVSQEDLATTLQVKSPSGDSLNSQLNNSSSLGNNENCQNGHKQQLLQLDCSFCHTPLICSDSINLLPNCSICKQAKVPEVLLLTIEPPANLNIVSKAYLVQARVCRAKRDSHGEVGAKEIGEALPFLEYELHRQLFSKLKFKGLNCVFNLTVDISVGENMISGLATGSGCFVLGLAQPEAPKISGGKGIKTSKLLQIQRLIESTSLKNRNLLNIDQINAQLEAYHESYRQQQPTDSSSRYGHKLTVASAATSAQSSGSKDLNGSGVSPTWSSLLQKPPTPIAASSPATTTPETTTASISAAIATPAATTTTLSGAGLMQASEANAVSNLLTDDNNIILEVDDTEDANIIALLIDSEIPDGYVVCNSESLPLVDQSSISNLNMFTQVMRAKLTGLDQFGHLFDWILQALFVKLRRSLPCCLTNVTYAVDLPESNVVQVTISGCLLAIQQPQRNIPTNGETTTSNNDEPATANKLVQSPSQNSMGSSNETSSSTATSPTTTATTTSKSSSPASFKGKRQKGQSEKSRGKGQNTSTSASPRTSSSVSSSSESLQSSSSANEKASKQNAKDKSKLSSASNAVGSKLLAKGQANISSLLSTSKSSIFNKNKNQQLQHLSEMEPQAIELSERNSIINKLDDMNNVQGENDLAADQNKKQASSSHLLRTVFKKQQTYPGAVSPALSGQDPKMGPFSGLSENSTGSNGASKVASGAAKRATILLNKVKQPLKDLGNSTNQSHHQSGSSHANGSGGKHQLHHSASTSLMQGPWPSSSKSQLSNNHAKNSLHQAASANTSQLDNQKSSLDTGANSHQTRLHQSHQQQRRNHPSQHHQSPANSSGKSNHSNAIDITSLSYIPGAKEYHYLGNLSFSFVRETGSVRENGGLNGFIHCFLMEVFAIVRAHVSALGGNAFLSLRLQQSCIWYHSNKNQAQCLISVAGDAVQVVY